MDVIGRTLLLLVCILVILSCSKSDQAVRTDVGEVDIESLPPGVAEIFDFDPESGAVLLLNTRDDVVYMLFEEDETCLLGVERSPLGNPSDPLIELGPDDLLSSKGCNSSNSVRNEGMISTDESSKRSLVSAVLPRDYWTEEWSLDDGESLGPFDVLGITPYSVHLVATPLEIAESRREGDLGQFLNVSITCECGEMSMQAYFL